MSLVVQPGEQIEVEIDSLEPHGRGVARYGQLVVFVPFVAPGEKVVAEITVLKKNYAEAVLVRVVSAVAERIAAPCPVFGECGGCQWQHLSHSLQLATKEQLLRSKFAKMFAIDEGAWRPIRPSPRLLHYRNRIQPVRTQKGWAFRSYRSHVLVEFEQCLIAEEPINRELARLALMVSPEQGKTEISISEADDVVVRNEAADDFENFFAQVNRFQNLEIQDDLRSCLQEFAGRQIFDLCCGAGNFSFVAAEVFKGSIVAVDGSRYLIRKAQEEASGRKLQSRMTFFASDLTNFLTSVRPNRESLVILDPPRTGVAPEVMGVLAAAEPLELIYISCNFVTLARDLEVFFKALRNLSEESANSISASQRYTWERIQSYEMFPQTPHFEVLVHLRRKN